MKKKNKKSPQKKFNLHLPKVKILSSHLLKTKLFSIVSSSLDIKLKASIEMKTFGIYLNQEGEIISEFFLSNFQAGVEMREKTLKAFVKFLKLKQNNSKKKNY